MRRIVLVCLLLVACRSEWDKLPVLSYTINDSGAKEIYAVEYPNGFVNQLGEEFSNNMLDDKVMIANFFFTRCPSICPPMRQQLIGVIEDLDEDDFLVISHSIDPINDTPDVLMAYAETTGISSKQWQFLTATEKTTRDQASLYQTNFKPFEDGTDFYHSSYVALVDRNRMIRGFYDLLKPKEVDLLKKDIQTLLD